MVQSGVPTRSSTRTTSKASNDAPAAEAKRGKRREKDAAPEPKRAKKTSMTDVVSESSATASASSEKEDESLRLELQQAHEALSTMPQDAVNEKVLGRLTTRLASREILQSPRKTVRALGARCLVDVLFLHAPEAPYEDATLKRVFSLLVESLGGLRETDKTKDAFKCARHVLDRMVLCNLPIVLVELPDVPGDGGVSTEQLSLNMFSTTLDAIAPNHDQSVESDVVKLLSLYLEHADEISPALLDELLRRLLPTQRQESHRACDVVRSVVQRCADRLRTHIADVVNGVLTGTFSGRGVRTEEIAETYLKDEVHALVLELYRIDPNLTVTILPNIQACLEVDDLDTRAQAVATLKSVFLEANESVVRDHDRLLHTLLARSVDKSPEIRSDVVEFAGRALTNTASPEVTLRARVLTHQVLCGTVSRTLFEHALNDEDPRVRSEAVDIVAHFLNVWDPTQTDASLASLGFDSLLPSVENVARELGERLKDRDVDIAARAATGLAWAFHLRVAPKWSTLSTVWTSDFLGWVPDLLLSQMSDSPHHGQDGLKLGHNCCLLVDRALLGTKLEPDARAVLATHLWGSLSPKARSAFEKWLFEQRVHLHTQLRKALLLRRQEAPNPGASKELFCALVKECVPESSGDAHAAALLWTLSDDRIFTRFEELCDNSVRRTHKELEELRRDLVERTGAAGLSKMHSAKQIENLKKLAKALTRRVAMLTLGSDDGCALLRLSLSKTTDNGNACDLADLLSKHFPEIVTSNHESMKIVLDLCRAGPDLTSVFQRRAFRTACKALECGLASSKHELKTSDLTRVLTSLTNNVIVVSKADEEEEAAGESDEADEEHVKDVLAATRVVCSIKDETSCSRLVDAIRKQATFTRSTLLALAYVVRIRPSSDSLVEVCEKATTFATRTAKAKFEGTTALRINRETRLKTACLDFCGAELFRRFTRASDAQESYGVSTKNVLLLLRRFVADGGDPWGAEIQRRERREGSKPLRFESAVWPMSSEDRYVQLRLRAFRALAESEAQHYPDPKAVKAALAEGSNPEDHIGRTAQRFVERARLAMDVDASARDTFGEIVCEVSLDKGFSMMRDGALLTIVASAASMEPGNPHGRKSLQTLRQLVAHLASKSREARLRHDEAKSLGFAPEFILPYLIFALAHHPLLPTRGREEDDGEYSSNNIKEFLSSPVGHRSLIRPLLTLIEALGAAHGAAHSTAKSKSGVSQANDASVSFMLAMLSEMRKRRDALDLHDSSIHLVGDLARKVVQQHAKYSPDGLEPYNGVPPLPSMFLVDHSNQSSIQQAVVATPRGQNHLPAVSSVSPVSYLPSGFELTAPSASNSLVATPGKRLSLGGPASSLGSAKKKKESKKRLSGASDASSSAAKRAKKSIETTPTRRQPSRGTKLNASYAEESSDSDEEEATSSEEDASSSEEESS